MSEYPQIAECSKYGAIAVFFEKDNGTLLISGSSWVREGALVNGNGFSGKYNFTISESSTFKERELEFLRVCGLPIGSDLTLEDLEKYKELNHFAYCFVFNYGLPL